MVSAIGSILSSRNISQSSQQALTPETKAQLQSLGVDTTNITTEAQGQTALQSSQGTQQTQGAQQSNNSGGSSSMQSLIDEAVSLAQKVGASVSSSDKLDDILSSINDALSKLQTEAANDPQKLALISQYQAEYQTLCQSVSQVQAQQQDSTVQQVSSQSGINALASYNIASMSISNSQKSKH